MDVVINGGQPQFELEDYINSATFNCSGTSLMAIENINLVFTTNNADGPAITLKNLKIIGTSSPKVIADNNSTL